MTQQRSIDAIRVRISAAVARTVRLLGRRSKGQTPEGVAEARPFVDTQAIWMDMASPGAARSEPAVGAG